MCVGKTPKAPAPLPERQPAKAPSISASDNMVDQRNRARMAFARMIYTPASGLAPAQTTGKTLLGS